MKRHLTLLLLLAASCKTTPGPREPEPDLSPPEAGVVPVGARIDALGPT